MSSERPAFTLDVDAPPQAQGTASRTPSREPARGAGRLLVMTEKSGATISTDGAGRIVAWSHAAEELLGHRASAVRGKPLHDVLRSRDIFGNRISCECGVREMLRRGEQVRRHVITVTVATGEAKKVVLFVRPSDPSSSGTHVYEIRPDARGRQGDRRTTDRSPARSIVGTLTPAELNVLRLLAGGMRAQGVASSLGVSLTTVRNHIQHLFRKLKVHTQGEAISLALRCGLV